MVWHMSGWMIPDFSIWGFLLQDGCKGLTTLQLQKPQMQGVAEAGEDDDDGAGPPGGSGGGALCAAGRHHDRPALPPRGAEVSGLI